MIINKLQVFILLMVLALVACNKNVKKEMESINELQPLEVLVGTYTNNKSKGVYKLLLNPNSGEIISKDLLVDVENPSFLTTSKNAQSIYVVQEKEKGKVTSFNWNDEKTKLIETSSVLTKGMHPCYVTLNKQENLLSVANYSSGNISLYQLNKDGTINNNFQTEQHFGQGKNLPRQESPHAHCVKFYKNKFLYAIDLGIDKVICYPIKTNFLGKQKVALKADDADGIRHLTFHPNSNIAYITTEFSNSVIVSKIDEETGKFIRIQKISMLPKNFAKESFAADIHVSNDGKFLYASNRGHNSIATFSIDLEGKLSLIKFTDTKGNWPRNFSMSKDNKFLIVANQFGNNIVVFKRNEKLGTLSFTGFETEVSNPVFVKFL